MDDKFTTVKMECSCGSKIEAVYNPANVPCYIDNWILQHQSCCLNNTMMSPAGLRSLIKGK